MGVVHRDIKPQNILVTKQGTAKLIDFSSAEKIGASDILKGTAGTYQFFSPEACDSTLYEHIKKLAENTEGIPGKATDMWALGVSVYAMLFNKLPFWGDSIMGILTAITKNPYSWPQRRVAFPKERTPSKLMAQLVEALLNKNPKKRLTAAQLLTHPALSQTS